MASITLDRTLVEKTSTSLPRRRSATAADTPCQTLCRIGSRKLA